VRLLVLHGADVLADFHVAFAAADADVVVVASVARECSWETRGRCGSQGRAVEVIEALVETERDPEVSSFLRVPRRMPRPSRHG